MSYPLLQVISVCPKDSMTIEQNGGNRVQLVSALQIGGLTPSTAIVRKCLEVVDIKTMVMVRHHNQGFVLDHQETQLLVQEAKHLVDLGCKGLVFGAITKDSLIDEVFLKRLSEEISFNKIDITFHKASDYTLDLVQAYGTLNKYNIPRVLTQGGISKIQDNFQILAKCLSTPNVKTLLGGGISHSNIQNIIKNLKPTQIHIGTCVRSNKYGSIEPNLLKNFINLMIVQ